MIERTFYCLLIILMVLLLTVGFSAGAFYVMSKRVMAVDILYSTHNEKFFCVKSESSVENYWCWRSEKDVPAQKVRRKR